MKQRGVKADEYLDFIEAEIIEDEKTMIEQRLVYERTKENFESLLDKCSVYKKAKQLSGGVNFSVGDHNEQQLSESMIEEGLSIKSSLKSISGIIKIEDEMRLKKMVFRVSRGMITTIIIS